MELIRPFERLGKGDTGIAGGKGASLGEMTQAGVPVPPGFVILAGAFERFLDEAGLNQELDTIFHSVNHEELRTVELASEMIRGLITSAKMPDDIAAAIRDEFAKLGAEFVAVRSSATAEDGATAVPEHYVGRCRPEHPKMLGIALHASSDLLPI
jgi:pyruvate, water dikinase